MRFNSYQVIILVISLLISLTNSTISIVKPKALADSFQQGRIESSLGKFGNIPYGFNIEGKLFYFDKALEDNQPYYSGCQWNKDFKITQDVYVIYLNPIVLVDRGDCSFVKKVANIEENGGNVAIIIDNVQNQDINTVVMAEDGHGNLINIPSAMISYADGMKLKDFMKKNPKEEIILDFDFEFEQSITSKLNLYLSSNQETVYQLLTSFSNYFEKLDKENAITITPHYITNPHPSYAEKDLFTQAEREELFKNCYGNGKYCVEGFVNNSKSIKVDASIIIEENLIQKCIFHQGTNKKDNSLYFNYMLEFYDSCYSSTSFTKKCGEDVIEKLNIDKKDIIQCVERSFNYSTTDESKTI